MYKGLERLIFSLIGSHEKKALRFIIIRRGERTKALFRLRRRLSLFRNGKRQNELSQNMTEIPLKRHKSPIQPKAIFCMFMQVFRMCIVLTDDRVFFL